MIRLAATDEPLLFPEPHFALSPSAVSNSADALSTANTRFTASAWSRLRQGCSAGSGSPSEATEAKWLRLHSSQHPIAALKNAAQVPQKVTLHVSRTIGFHTQRCIFGVIIAAPLISSGCKQQQHAALGQCHSWPKALGLKPAYASTAKSSVVTNTGQLSGFQGGNGMNSRPRRLSQQNTLTRAQGRQCSSSWR